MEPPELITRKGLSKLWWHGFPAVFAGLMSFLICTIIILILGYNPPLVYQQYILGALGSPRRISETLLAMMPLLLGGLGFYVAYQGGCFNVGGVGQMWIGGLAATGIGVIVALLCDAWWVIVPIALIEGFVCGAGFATIAGVLKTELQVNEVISTVILNYVGLQFSYWAIRYIFHDPRDYLPWSWLIPEPVQLPMIFYRLNIGVFLVIILVPVIYILVRHTRWGLRIRAVGKNSSAASAMGINVRKSTWLAMFLSGGLFGLAGAMQVLGVHWRISSETVFDQGYTAIAVAFLGNLHPFGVVVASVIFAILAPRGTVLLFSGFGPFEWMFPAVFQGLVILFWLVGVFLRNHWKKPDLII